MKELVLVIMTDKYLYYPVTDESTQVLSAAYKTGRTPVLPGSGSHRRTQDFKTKVVGVSFIT